MKCCCLTYCPVFSVLQRAPISNDWIKPKDHQRTRALGNRQDTLWDSMKDTRLGMSQRTEDTGKEEALPLRRGGSGCRDKKSKIMVWRPHKFPTFNMPTKQTLFMTVKARRCYSSEDWGEQMREVPDETMKCFKGYYSWLCIFVQHTVCKWACPQCIHSLCAGLAHWSRGRGSNMSLGWEILNHCWGWTPPWP